MAIFFVRSGVIDIDYGYLGRVGANSYYWSRSGVGPSVTHDFDFNVSTTYPSGGPNARFYGFSLRCLQE